MKTLNLCISIVITALFLVVTIQVQHIAATGNGGTLLDTMPSCALQTPACPGSTPTPQLSVPTPNHGGRLGTQTQAFSDALSNYVGSHELQFFLGFLVLIIVAVKVGEGLFFVKLFGKPFGLYIAYFRRRPFHLWHRLVDLIVIGILYLLIRPYLLIILGTLSLLIVLELVWKTRLFWRTQLNNIRNKKEQTNEPL